MNKKVADKTMGIILTYFEEVHGFIPRLKQYKEIQNKEELAELIKKEKPIEWEWTVELSGNCYSCCEDGARMWVLDTLNELFTVSIDKVVWNPNWREDG